MKSNREIAEEVLKGLWGNGKDRQNMLTSAGYDYNEIQKIVNDIVNGKEPDPESELLVVNVDLRKYKGVALYIEG